MDNKALIWIVAIVGIFYFLFKKNPATSTSSSVLRASTVSPIGSASGILTPVLGTITSGLTGLEAFLQPTQTAPVPTQTQLDAQVATNIATDQFTTTEAPLSTSLAIPADLSGYTAD